MKAAAQVESCRFAAVPRTNHDAAVKPGDGDGLVQGLGIAGKFKGQVRQTF